MNKETTHSRKPRLLWRKVVLGALLIGLGAYLERFLFEQKDIVLSEANSESSEQIAALEGEVQRLRAVEARLSQELKVLRSAENNPTVSEKDTLSERQKRASASQPTDDPAWIEEQDLLAASKQRNFFDVLTERVETEAIDQPWREQTERAMTESLSRTFNEQELDIDSIICASSLCRARVTHSDSAELPQTKLMSFMMNRGDLASMQVHVDTRDGETLLYFMRASDR